MGLGSDVLVDVEFTGGTPSSVAWGIGVREDLVSVGLPSAAPSGRLFSAGFKDGVEKPLASSMMAKVLSWLPS